MIGPPPRLEPRSKPTRTALDGPAPTASSGVATIRGSVTARRRGRMRIKLHHVNLCTKDVAAMDAFYREVLDLRPEPSLNDNRVTGEGYAGKVAFVSDGDVQVHLA